jgi:hypothetical protein
MMRPACIGCKRQALPGEQDGRVRLAAGIADSAVRFTLDPSQRIPLFAFTDIGVLSVQQEAS